MGSHKAWGAALCCALDSDQHESLSSKLTVPWQAAGSQTQTALPYKGPYNKTICFILNSQVVPPRWAQYLAGSKIRSLQKAARKPCVCGKPSQRDLEAVWRAIWHSCKTHTDAFASAPLRTPRRHDRLTRWFLKYQEAVQRRSGCLDVRDCRIGATKMCRIISKPTDLISLWVRDVFGGISCLC